MNLHLALILVVIIPVNSHYIVTGINNNKSLLTILFNGDYTHDPPSFTIKCKWKSCAYNYKIGQKYCLDNATIIICSHDESSSDVKTIIVFTFFGVMVVGVISGVIFTIIRSFVKDRFELRTIELSETLKPCDAAPEQDCVICLDNLTDECVSLPCQHKFHKDCIEPWITNTGSCPSCRWTCSEGTRRTQDHDRLIDIV